MSNTDALPSMTKKITKKLQKELLDSLAVLFPQEVNGTQNKQQLSAWLQLRAAIAGIHDTDTTHVALGEIEFADFTLKLFLSRLEGWRESTGALIVEARKKDGESIGQRHTDINMSQLLGLLSFSATQIANHD